MEETPLRSVLYLSIGPFMSQIAYALNGLICSYWTSHVIGAESLTVFGASMVVDFIPEAFCDYLMSAVSLRMAYLIGKKKTSVIGQMFVDFIRIGVIIYIPLVFLLAVFSRRIIKTLEAPDKVVNESVSYLLPSIYGSIVNFMYSIANGLLISQGRSILFGVIQIVTLLISSLIVYPAMFLLFKVSIWGASLSVVVSRLVVILFLVTMRKRWVDVNMKMCYCKIQ